MMLKIILCGALGQMGMAVYNCIKDSKDLDIFAGVDIAEAAIAPFPIYGSINDVPPGGDVIIDFSKPDAVEDNCEYAAELAVPYVVCTTGLIDTHKQAIAEASQRTAVFFSPNMSYGISVLRELVRRAAVLLSDDFDVEIVEMHHNIKEDSPSGTALALADAISEAADKDYNYTYGREGRRTRRDVSEMGIHALRGGSVVGDHQIIFAGRDEVIKLSHSASSRTVFARGALRAARFIKNKAPGLYNMNDLFEE